MCSVKDCGGFVVGRGYCSRHYARWRRGKPIEEPAGPSKGRPKYPQDQVELNKDGISEGGPKYTMRLAPSTYRWLMDEAGAQPWLRQVVERLHELSEKERHEVWKWLPRPGGGGDGPS